MTGVKGYILLKRKCERKGVKFQWAKCIFYGKVLDIPSGLAIKPEKEEKYSSERIFAWCAVSNYKYNLHSVARQLN